MKRCLLAMLVLVFALMLGAPGLFAADLHKVQLTNISPFSIDQEFPQTLEKGSFEFRPMANGEVGELRYMLVVARSQADPNYQLLLLVVTVDGGKTIHVVAALSGQVKNGKAVNVRIYQDEQFFSGKGFSGILLKTKEFPGLEDLERVAPPEKVKGLEA